MLCSPCRQKYRTSSSGLILSIYHPAGNQYPKNKSKQKEILRKQRERKSQRTGKIGRMVANAAKKVHDQLLKKLESDKKYADIKNLNLKGNRIVNLTHFGKELEQVMAHSKHCPQGGSPKLDKEVERDGLYTVLVFRCHDCGLNINVETQPSKKLEGSTSQSI